MERRELVDTTMRGQYNLKETDVLVVGGGMAGLWASIRAKDFAEKVTLVEKGKVGRSGASVFVHATLAPVPEDRFREWEKELVQRSGYLIDPAWPEIILREASQRLKDMERWGVMFERDKSGNLRTETVRGQKMLRDALFLGRQAMECMRQEALRRGVEFVERVMVTDLLTSDGNHPTEGHIVGAVGLHTRTGEFLVFRCKAAVISAGGISSKLHLHYIDNVTGDGQAMAFRAGAELGSMEVSAEPMFGIWNRRFCTGGQMQFLMNGAKIVNRLGERFMKKYATPEVKRPEFDGQIDFGDLCRAISIEIMEGRGPVYFDFRDWSRKNIDKLRKVLPVTMAAFNDAGIDVKKQLVETTPIVGNYGTAGQSGIRINTDCQSTVRGLFAAGVSSMIGRGTSPQAICHVAGYRAGENSAELANRTQYGELIKAQIESLKGIIFGPCYKKDGVSADHLYYLINRAVIPIRASFFKNEKGIKATIEEIQRIAQEELPRVKADDAHELVKANEARNFVLLMESVFTSALERKESRFTTHYREDHPYTDNENWLRWVLLKNDGKGGIQVRTEPVPLHPVEKPSEPLRVPVPISFLREDGNDH